MPLLHGHQLVVFPLLDNAAFSKDDNHVGGADGGEAMNEGRRERKREGMREGLVYIKGEGERFHSGLGRGGNKIKM